MRAIGLVLLALVACKSQPSDASTGRGPKSGEAQPVNREPSARDYPAPPLPRTKVVLADAYGGKHALEVELCLTDAMRARGMMWRTELAPGKGMLFVFPDEEWRSFWMKNTLIPLDIVFIDAEQRIVGIVENAQPQTLTSRAVRGDSKYVLEVPGGWTAKVGIRKGGRVEIEGVEKLAPR